MDASNEDEEEDLGALIDRESQLRKKEDAAAGLAKKRRRNSSSSTRRSTSTRQATAGHKVTNSDVKMITSRLSSKRSRRSSGNDEERKVHTQVARKKYRYECSADGCTNHVVNGGVCIRHGAKIKLCSSEGCTNVAQKGGVCIRHGAKVKRCSTEGCANQAKRGGLCWRHGAKCNTGSKFDKTTATLTLPNERASRAAVKGRQVRNVPRELTILC